MPTRFVHDLDARAKILGFIVFTVVVVSTPARSLWAFLAYAAVLAFVAGWARIPAAALARRLALVLPVLVAVLLLLPFLGREATGDGSAAGWGISNADWLVVWNAGVKAVLGVACMSLLGLTTPLPELIAGFQRLRTPAVLLLIVSFMARYGVVFAEELARSRRALASRNFRARWLGNVPVLGHMLGALFLRSYSRGERVYLAMLSRGYTGSMPLASSGRFGAPEMAFLFSLVTCAALTRVLLAA